MADIIPGGEVVNRGVAVGPGVHPVCNPAAGRIGQKNRAGIGITGIDMADPVRFFFSAGHFMFFNDIFGVIVNGCTADNSGLNTAEHRFPVDVQAWFFILDINTVRTHPL